MKMKEVKLWDKNGRAIPYVLGWLMGIPLSVLILIYLLRG